MPKVPHPYEVNGKLVTGNGSLIPICSLPNRSLLASLTVLTFFGTNFHSIWHTFLELQFFYAFFYELLG